MQKYKETQLEPNGYTLPATWEKISHQYSESKLEGDPPGSRVVLRRDEEHGTYIAVYTPGDGYFGEYLDLKYYEDAWYEGHGWEGFTFRATEEVLSRAMYGMRDGYAWYIDPDIEAVYYLWQAEQRSGIGSGRISVSFSHSATSAESAESATNDTVDPTDDISLEMVDVPQGEFLMGSPETELRREDNEGPQHKVMVPAFHISKCPITQRQWQLVAALDPVDIPLESRPSKFKGDNRPVEQVNWFEAVEFCKRLSKQTGNRYRLPSEAEWEYACRATQNGTSTPFHFGETINTEQVNYNGQHTNGEGETGIYREQTTTVGSFPANAFGIHDMHGNVWEWCADVGHDNYDDAPTDGSVWMQGGALRDRILRGASWGNYQWECRSARRLSFNAGTGNYFVGFRVVCSSLKDLPNEVEEAQEASACSATSAELATNDTADPMGEVHLEVVRDVVQPGDYAGIWHGHAVSFSIQQIFPAGELNGVGEFIGGPHRGIQFGFTGQVNLDGRLTISRDVGIGSQVASRATFEIQGDSIVWQGLTKGPGIGDAGLPFEFRAQSADLRQTLAQLSRSTTSAESSSDDTTEPADDPPLEAANNAVDPPDDIPLEMVYVPEGEFLMGSPETELGHQENEAPQHKVTVPAFHMSKYPITQRQWRVVALLDPVDMPLELNPSSFKGDELPVERVSWNSALEFCKRLSKQTGDRYRLPSEAEWEYACRATQDGTSTPFYFGETISTEQANYNAQEAYGEGETGVNREQTTTVGSFPANAFGLHDMHGNVWEWCDDVWHNNYEGAPTDSRVWAQGGEPGNHVLRGGDWLFSPKDCRSARRLHFSSGLDYILTGFRIVCSSESPETEVEQKESERPPLGELHVTALGEDGRFFHALRTSNGDWHGFNDGSGILNADGNGRIAAAIVAGELHVCLLKKMHPPFFHAIRQSDGSWEGFNDCSRLPSGDGGSFMSCARVGAELHVCWVSGNSVFRAVRKADGNWNGFYDCSWLPNVDYPIDGLSCAGVGNELHVCMIKGRQLFHGVRKPDGSWEGFNDCSWLPNSDKILFSGLGCAGIGNELHVCLCSIEGRFFHGIRKSDGSWEGFHDYSWIPNSNRIDSLSCVGIGNELHVCCIADQQFFHGIRKPDGSWEGFNDCSAIPNSSGFTDIVCAGF